MFRCAASPIVAMTLVVLACGETSGQPSISLQTPPDNSLSFESWDIQPRIGQYPGRPIPVIGKTAITLQMLDTP